MVKLVDKVLKRLRLGRPVKSGKVTIIHANVLDKPVMFCVDMKNDPIQRNHRRGSFYELKELKQLMRVFPKNGVFVDIGANVGNHSLFAAHYLNPSKVISFEPNPKAFNLLIQNVLINGHRDLFDLTHLGVGLSDSHTEGYGMEKRERNLGGAKMLEGKGSLEVYRGDELLAEEKPALIKIDVEGMEMAVLNGLSGVFERCKPILLVEVGNENEDDFMAWVKTNKYTLVETTQRYRLNKNHLLMDTKTAAKAKKKIKELADA